MPIYPFLDFRGGYSTNIPYELMQPNELLKAENCYWDNGLEKRKGYTQFETFWATADGIRGFIRNTMADGNKFLLARDDATRTMLYYGASSTFTLIASGSVNFQSAYDVQFAALNDTVIGVNGQKVPIIIFNSATAITAKTLQEYDMRERGTSTWWGGQYDNSTTTIAGKYVDDTDHAQGTSTASGFQLAHPSASDGFWLSCDFTYTKMDIASCPQFSVGAAFTASYGIYVGSGSWSAPSMVQTPTWSAAAGTRTIEWDWAPNWTPADEDLSSTELNNRYVFRVWFSDISATYDAGQASLNHAQFLSEVMGGDLPQAVCVHNSRLFLAAENNVYLSLANEASGWSLRRAEYFLDGGDEIVQMVSYKDYLLVFKERAIYGLFGNALDGWVKTKLISGIGTNSRRSVVSTGDEVWFVNDDGVWIWNGTEAIKVSKHIRSDFDVWAATLSSWHDLAAGNYEGQYWLSCYAAEQTLMADPDTFRRDDVGDGRVSFYKLNNYGFRQFVYAQDRDKFFGLRDGGAYSKADTLCVLETATYGDTCWGSTDAVDMQVQTGYRIYGNSFMEDMGISRFKVKQAEASASAGQYSTVIVYGEDGDNSSTITCTSPVGTGYYTDYWTLPYNLDGKNISFHYQHNTAYKARLIGYSLEAYRRFF